VLCLNEHKLSIGLVQLFNVKNFRNFVGRGGDEKNKWMICREFE